MSKFTDPWGFSKLDVFRACPQKFKFQFMDKLPTGSSPAMERGSHIHTEIETYLNGWSKTLPEDVESWKEAFDALREHDFRGEQAIGLNKQWQLLPDWFSKATWLRVKMDAYYKEGDTITVIDFKTGKYRVPSTDQIELYAIAGLSIYPEAQKVNAEFWFLDSDDLYKREYLREELVALRKKYERESEAMYNTEVWAPAPSRECRWCPFSKTKGGKCSY